MKFPKQIFSTRRFALRAFVICLSLPFAIFSQTARESSSKEDLLFKAVNGADLQQARQLIKEGVNVNAQSGTLKMSPLHFAVDRGDVEIAKVLLEAGADPNIAADNDLTPILMLDANATTELVDLLLKRGADVKAKTRAGYTVLHNTQWSSPEVARSLINAGAEIDAQESNKQRTPLMLAAQNGDLNYAKILLEAGAKPDVKNQDGETAFSLASKEEMKRLLRSFETRENKNK